MNFKNFKIIDLFEIEGTHPYKRPRKYIVSKRGTVPVIANSSVNNGIVGYSSLPPTNHGNVVTFSDTVDSYQTVFYQAQPFIGYSHVKKLVLRDNRYLSSVNQYIWLYICASLVTSIRNKYSYGMKYNKSRQQATEIRLPVTSENEVNTNYMTNIIKKYFNQNLVKLEQKLKSIK